MSIEQVKAIEDKKPDFEINIALAYKVKIDVKDFTCIYQFLEDKLYNSGYIFTGGHANKNLYIDDHEELKETLTKKYGKPIKDEMEWKNDLYKDDKSEWGMAISIGDLRYWTSWEISTTRICLMLRGDNYKVSLSYVMIAKN